MSNLFVKGTVICENLTTAFFRLLFHSETGIIKLTAKAVDRKSYLYFMEKRRQGAILPPFFFGILHKPTLSHLHIQRKAGAGMIEVLVGQDVRPALCHLNRPGIQQAFQVVRVDVDRILPQLAEQARRDSTRDFPSPVGI